MAKKVAAMASGKMLRPSNGLVRVNKVFLFEVVFVQPLFSDTFLKYYAMPPISIQLLKCHQSCYQLVYQLFQLNYFRSILGAHLTKYAYEKVQQELFFFQVLQVKTVNYRR